MTLHYAAPFGVVVLNETEQFWSEFFGLRSLTCFCAFMLLRVQYVTSAQE